MSMWTYNVKKCGCSKTKNLCFFKQTGAMGPRFYFPKSVFVNFVFSGQKLCRKTLWRRNLLPKLGKLSEILQV